MDYSPLLPRSESPSHGHPLLLEEDFEEHELDEIKKFPLIEENDYEQNSSFEFGGLGIVKSSKSSKSKSNKKVVDSQNNSGGGSRIGTRGKMLFGRRSLSKSKSASEEVSASLYIEDIQEEQENKGSSNKKSSSPIEIKGSPGKNRDGISNKGDSTGDNHHSSSNNKISFFKVLTRRNSSANQGKHKKLQDHWIQAKEPVLDGVTFCVKFLGSTLIEKAGATDAAEATKTVIQMVKAGHKPARLGLTVCTSGITLSDPTTGEIRLEISIYDIAHCSADANHPNVFSFIATNKNDVNECYCFATRKRKMSQHITLTIAQAFNLAFELWQGSSLESSSNQEEDYPSKVIIGSTDSAKSCSSTGSSGSTGVGGGNSSQHKNHSQWVHFDQEDEVEDLTNHMNSINMITLSPFHRNSNTSNNDELALTKTAHLVQTDTEDLLICLN